MVNGLCFDCQRRFKIFIGTAIGFNTISYFLNILSYYFYGLEGLGLSFSALLFDSFFGLNNYKKKRYGFYFENGFYNTYLICILLCGATFPIPSNQF
jgi:hypothetical protein